MVGTFNLSHQSPSKKIKLNKLQKTKPNKVPLKNPQNPLSFKLITLPWQLVLCNQILVAFELYSLPFSENCTKPDEDIFKHLAR
jgi:hypothetical protein